MDLWIPFVDTAVELCEDVFLRLNVALLVSGDGTNDDVLSTGEDVGGDLVEGVGFDDRHGVGVTADDGGTGLLGDDDAGADVPSPTPNFPVEIQASAGDVAEVECGRANRSYALCEFAADNAGLSVTGDFGKRRQLPGENLGASIAAPFKCDKRLVETGERLRRGERQTLWSRIVRRRDE